MSLIKKMSIIVLTMLMLIFICCYIISLNNGRNYFIEQMNSNAQDTATSLGLSLSQSMYNNDQATILAMIQAVFDRGYFSSIEVRDIHGKILFSRKAPLYSNKVPSWFFKLIHWSPKAQSAIVTHGWNQVGEVVVLSDSNYSVKALWSNANELVILYLKFAFISLLLVYFFIQWLLTPLKHVTKQAHAICNSEFPIESYIPNTPELKEVTLAMNKMVLRLKHLFHEHLEQMEVLRYQSFQDPLTSLGNRRFFLQQLGALLKNEEEFAPGYLLLIAIDGLDNLNKERGYQQGDKIILQVSQACLSFWDSSLTNNIARISGSNFTLLIHENDSNSFIKKSQVFNASLQELFKDNSFCKIYLAAVAYQLHQSPSEVLTEVDMVLQKARLSLDNIAYEEGHKITENLTIPTKLIMAGLTELALILYAQSVLSAKECFHQEILVRMEFQEQQVNAGYFMPIAEKIGKAHAVDLFVLSSLIEKQDLITSPVAINLSEETIANEKYLDNFIKKLKKLPFDLRRNLHLEINAGLILKYYKRIKTFVTVLNKLEIKVGIDQVGIHFSPMDYLNELKISYLKLHGSLIHDLAENKNKQFFIHYLQQIATILDIQLIATQIETAMQWEALQQIHIQWGQGRYLEAVKPFG